ncbi:MAG TPA: ATPase, T2SS/T4P/T4SS family [Candidatus Bathyarchaeia archaeon]|nr:ATPase, T2SS/T4P/T4SS family [Candidatus Bathyarchaeia archaeon]
MQVDNEQLKSFALDVGLATEDQINEAIDEGAKSGKKLGDVLVEKKLVNSDQLRQLYSYILGVPFVNIEKEIIPKDILQLVPEPIAKKYKIVAYKKTGTELKVAMLNPEDIQTIDFIRKKTGLKVSPCITTEKGIENALKLYEQSLKAEFGDIIEKNAPGVSQEDSLEKVAQEMPVIRIVEALLKHAILQDASDIHIEPDEKEVRIRYRIDGMLHDAMTLPKTVLAGIVARIKILSNLKLDEHRLPQDGRFKIEQDDRRIAFRVSILPVYAGEKIVMRLLDEGSKGLTLEAMGLWGEALEKIHRAIKKPNGMILVTGPTGSGKTTTLYTVMDILNTPKVNISTVEDPIEYKMSRINQTQVNPTIGLTFSQGLRALLRQDPDIIMVGEIRDNETMEIAIHAAMTGHLVLSTLHTNSAAGTVPRLLDMGAEPFLIASTVNVVMAQRLVRKLCPDCRQSFTLDAELLKSLSEEVDFDHMLSMAAENNFINKNAAQTKDWSKINFFRATGCERCNREGYKGRIGIYEVMEISEDIAKMVSARSDSNEIEKKAREEGMMKMLEDGMVKALQGLTSIEEILRVTKD